MKTGLIIYVTGRQPQVPDPDKPPVIENLEMEPDALEVITQSGGHYDISDAWWALVTKGMERVICKIGRWSADGRILLTDQQMRLCG